MSLKDVQEEDESGETLMLPGFRFHPTDEELVTFYLRRKVAGKSFAVNIIKVIDIYKHDPWDLQSAWSNTAVSEKEWYFFCLRGRKYRNSIRPNRVTRSGFWKATGIDRPIYSASLDCGCVGLKKSLVYYRGSAGKGTKTDWMMHEFRLPPDGKIADDPQEAEVWTICRIFKRNLSHRKYPAVQAWRSDEAAAAISKTELTADSSSISSSTLEQHLHHHQQKQEQEQHFEIVGDAATTPPETLVNMPQQQEEEVAADLGYYGYYDNDAEETKCQVFQQHQQQETLVTGPKWQRQKQKEEGEATELDHCYYGHYENGDNTAETNFLQGFQQQQDRQDPDDQWNAAAIDVGGFCSSYSMDTIEKELLRECNWEELARTIERSNFPASFYDYRSY